jgi:hypothetical protein
MTYCGARSQRTIAIQFWERRLRESFAELPSFDLEGPST